MGKQTIPPGYVSTVEAANRLYVSKQTVLRYIKAGRIRGARRIGLGRTAAIAIPETEIERVIKSTLNFPRR